MAIAKVIIDVSLDKEFDYLIPETLLPQIKVGVMVRVPFGHSTREGYVLSLADSSDYTGGRLKPITGLCETRANIPEHIAPHDLLDGFDDLIADQGIQAGLTECRNQ